MKITFLTGLYFPMMQHSNYMDLSIDTIADIRDIKMTKIHIT